jgi:processive 1,2-diacylglycerol beta-glucosyltransferase
VGKQILIFIEAIGNGHTNAAEELREGISYLAPSVQT